MAKANTAISLNVGNVTDSDEGFFVSTSNISDLLIHGYFIGISLFFLELHQYGESEHKSLLSIG